MARCAHCGAPTGAGPVCQSCGAPVTAPPAAAPEAQAASNRPRSSARNVVLVLAVIVALAVGAVGGYLVGRSGSDAPAAAAGTPVSMGCALAGAYYDHNAQKFTVDHADPQYAQAVAAIGALLQLGALDDASAGDLGSDAADLLQQTSFYQFDKVNQTMADIVRLCVGRSS